jgi:outer membrane protein assembly factor BamB
MRFIRGRILIFMLPESLGRLDYRCSKLVRVMFGGGLIAAQFVTAQTASPAAAAAAAQKKIALERSAALVHQVGPFLQKNCVSCHNTAMPSGNVDMQQLLATPDSLQQRVDTWMNISSMIRSGAMPPPGAPYPSKPDATATAMAIFRAVASTPRYADVPMPKLEPVKTKDWLTFSYDPQRTGWAREETTISRETAPHLHLLWKLQTDTQPDPVNQYSTLTEPIVVNDVATKDGPKKLVYVGGRDDQVYAVDAVTGTVYWKRSFPNDLPRPVPANHSCPENLNATPVVDRGKGILYFLTNDGKLRGVSLADGSDRFPATDMVPPYSRNFSLNLVDGWIVTGNTRGCANAASQVAFLNVDDPAHPVNHFFTSPGKGSGPWGRGGIISTPFGWVTQTADGAYDPLSGRWGDTVLSFTRTGILTDSFTPANEPYINGRDLDLGSSSAVVFPFDGRTLVATAGKEGVIYLLDARRLGGANHRTPLYTSPRWSNDVQLFGFNGMWSVMSTYVDSQGRRWLLAPFYGPVSKQTLGLFKKCHGTDVNGELMAFTVEGTADHPRLAPQWVSGDLDLPGVAVVADNVVLILANGDRGSTLVPRPQGRWFGAGGGRRMGPPTVPLTEVNPAEPGFEDDAKWRSDQFRPFAQGGQQPGQRYQGGRETTHAVLYALDPATGDELYSSGDAIDSWNHYGELSVSDGDVYLSTWAGKVYAFGVGQE